MSRIDYCNSAMAGLPQTTIASLQRVQNAAARLVFELGPKRNMSLEDFSSCTGFHNITDCLQNAKSNNLSNTVRSVGASRSRSGRHFPSTTHCLAYEPNSACVHSHTLVLELETHSEDIRTTSDSVVFRRQLKTYYFSLAFNVF